MGKLVDVGTEPCGASVALLSLPDWAHAAVATSSTNNNVFFMLPPEPRLQSAGSYSPVQLSARKESPQPEGNNRVRVGQGYDGVSQFGAKVFGLYCESVVAYAFNPL